MPFHLDHSSPEIMSLLLYRYFCKLVKIWPLQWTFLEVMSLCVLQRMGLKSFKRYMMIFFFSLVIDELVLCLILWTGWSVCCRSFIVHCKMQPEMQLVCYLDESSLVVVTIAWLWHRRSRVEARYDAKRAGRSRCFPFKKKSLAPAFCSFHRKKALEKVGIRHSLCRTACMQTIWGLT